MNADELQELIKKLLAKGVTVLVLVVGPAGQLVGVESGDTASPPAISAEPGRPSTGEGAGQDPTTATPGAEPSTGPPGTGGAAPVPGVATVPPTGTWSEGDQGARPQTGTAPGGPAQDGTAGGTGDAADGTGSGGGDVGDTRSGTGGGSEQPSGNGGGDAGGAGGRTDAGSGDGTTDENGAPATGDGGGAGVSSGQGTTAAQTLGWGNAVRADDFTGGTEGWSIYDGPGHAGNGRRTPDAVSIRDGILTITGDSEGNTAGMAWNPGQKYGRWEGRVKAPAADPSYNALLLLWPDAENFPEGGEVDFMEMMDPARRKTNLFLHYGADNSQVSGDVEIDATQWHNWAVEWTPDHIAAFVDGKQWWKTTDTSILPPGPMHLCIQLDWFPKGGGVKESTMQVDWVKQYALDGASADGSGQQAGSGPEQAAPEDSRAGG